MAVLTIKQIEVIALQRDAKAIIELLQRRGVVQITRHEDIDSDPKAKEILTQFQTQTSVTQFDKNYQMVNSALTVLSRYVPEKKSLAASLSGRKELTLEQFAQRAQETDLFLHKAREILALSKKIEASHTAILHTKSQLEGLLLWESLDIPMQYQGTSHTSAFIGSFPSLYTEESLVAALKESHPDPQGEFPSVYVEIVSSSREITCVAVLCHKADETIVKSALREIGFTLPSDPTKHPPSDRLNRFRQRIEDSQREIESVTEELTSYRDNREGLEFLSDYLLMRKDKYEILGNLHFSRKVFVLNGFIPQKDQEALEKELSSRFEVSVVFDTPADDEIVPVLLKNNSFVAPIEDITEAYSLPSKDDVDPNPFMAFFYYLFFGMMLSDAGYGLLIVLGTSFILLRLKPEGSLKRNMQKFFYCGFSTLFWGAMYGSWFGNIVNVVAVNFFGSNAALLPLWFDPVNNPLKLLIFSLILGFIHVMTGLILKFHIMWKHGNKLDALFDVGLWWVVFLGLGGVIASMVLTVSIPLQTIGLYIAAAGGAGLVLTQGRSSKSIPGKVLGGIASLYGITGYFSDILSYSRLMALGLVTGIIGNVVNTIGSINGGGIVGALILIPVFIFGHSINIGINLLGAYVHGNRLQYVEFFSKFYEGGGNPFRPFGVHTKHFKFKEDK